MSKLIICEKPSQAQAVGSALGLNNRQDGYLTNGDICCTWCFGHLFERINPDGKWEISNLPISNQPTNNQIDFYEIKNDSGVKKQFKVIKDLISKVDEVICATDPDAEGEAIYREVVESINYLGKQSRMWLKDLTNEGINNAYNNRQDISEYEGLRQRAYARSYFDWSYGLTFTQLTTLIEGQLFNVGRVQTPTLKLIVDRYQHNANFKSEKKQTLDAKLSDEVKATLKKECSDFFTSVEQCENFINQNKDFKIEVEEKQSKVKPKSLHNLTSIQKFGNQKLGLTPQQVLDKLQKLYELKLISYPRTDCNKLSPNTADDLNKKFGKEIKNVVGQVSAHEGLTPTTRENKVETIDDEVSKKLYEEIYYTTLGNFYDDVKTQELVVKIIDEDNQLEWNKKVVTYQVSEFDWKSIPYFSDEKISGEISQNIFDEIKNNFVNNTFQKINFSIREYDTKPKPLYTDATLLSSMENIHNEIEDYELKKVSKEVQGIGTPATRGSIIESLFKRGYVVKKNKNIIPTEKGIELINVLIKLNNPLLDLSYSAKLEQQLKEVEEKKNLVEFINLINNELLNEVNSKKSEVKTPQQEVITTCTCGGEVVKLNGKYGEYFKCNSCGLQFSNHNFSKEEVNTLINGGESSVKDEISKKGKPYKAMYTLENNKLVPIFVNSFK